MIDVADMEYVMTTIIAGATMDLLDQTAHQVITYYLVVLSLISRGNVLGTCPKDKAWADKAIEVDTAHSLAECSNRGNCDRKTVRVSHLS